MPRIASTPFVLALLVFVTFGAVPGLAEQAVTPVVPGYGAATPVPDGRMQPTLENLAPVAFDVTTYKPGQDKPAKGLDYAAKFLNILGTTQYPVAQARLEVVAHSDAAFAMMGEAAYKARFNATNPNTALIGALAEKGVTLCVCAQSLAERGVALEAIDSRVQVVVSAMTSLAMLHKQGYTLLFY